MTLPAAIAKTAKGKPGAPGRPKDLSKGAAILEAAKRLFLEQGYEGVSMDQIAADAGVSKLTVYSHFGDKEALFGEAVKAYCEQQLPSALFTDCAGLPVRDCLLEIGHAFVAMVMSPGRSLIESLRYTAPTAIPSGPAGSVNRSPATVASI